jgi:hypothetical protein
VRYSNVQLKPSLNTHDCTLYRSHADFTVLTDEEVVSELERVEEAFDKILGIKPRLFRFPYGNYDERVLGILAQRQYTGGKLSMLCRVSNTSLVPCSRHDLTEPLSSFLW